MEPLETERLAQQAGSAAPAAGAASRALSWLRAWVQARPRTACALLSVLLLLSSLGNGFVVDDFNHRAFVQEWLRSHHGHWWDMFLISARGGQADTVYRISLGVLPWWTLPELRIAMLRPLAVATHYMDYGLWPESAWLMHAENIALYAIVVALAVSVYLRLTRSRPIAALACVLYTIDEAHAEGAGWIASRNTLMTAIFVLTTVVLYDRNRREGDRRARWLAPLTLLTAFASSEGAIVAWAMLIPYALLLEPRLSDQHRVEPFWRRLLALWPLVLVTLAWVVLYRLLGYGMHGSGIYRDPLDAPWYFLKQRLPEVAPQVWQEHFTLPSILLRNIVWLNGPWWTLFWMIATLCASLRLLQLARREREIGFWLLAFVGCALPVCAVGVTPRLLFLTGVPAAALLSHLLFDLWRLARAPRRQLWVRTGAAALGLLFGFVQLPLALALAPAMPLELHSYNHMFERSAHSLPQAALPTTDALFVLNTPNYFVTALSPFYAKPGEWPRLSYILGAAFTPIALTRVSTDAFTLEPFGGYLLEPLSLLMRAPEYRFVVGQRIRNGFALVTIESIMPDGRPLRVRFEIPRLANTRLLFVTWHNDRYQRVLMPELSKQVVLPGL